MSEITSVIADLVAGRSLGQARAEAVLHALVEGEVSAAQAAAVLVAWRIKGETVEELLGAVRAVRGHARAIAPSGPLLDTCGTGGDQRHTFNVSTAAALVAATAGVRVAKHGNRSASGFVGSADILEALGMRIDLPPERVQEGIDELGFGFLFAPRFHPAMRNVAPVRREIGIRTIFNLIGPLANPAGAQHQLVGVFDRRWLEPVVRVLSQLGALHVIAVHAHDGLDELSLSAPTDIVEWCGGQLKEYRVEPEDVGLVRRPLAQVVCSSLDEARQRMEEVLSGQGGACAELTALNAGAALYAADAVGSLAEGVTRAQEVLASGLAWKKLRQIVEWSQG